MSIRAKLSALVLRDPGGGSASNGKKFNLAAIGHTSLGIAAPAVMEKPRRGETIIIGINRYGPSNDVPQTLTNPLDGLGA